MGFRIFVRVCPDVSVPVVPYIAPFPKDFAKRVGVPTGIRTRVSALKGPRPRPLDDGDSGRQVKQPPILTHSAAGASCWRGRGIKYAMRTALITLVLAVAIWGEAQAQGTVTTWAVDGVQRRAVVFAPARPQPMPLPLVFAFHGAGDTADNFTGVDFQHTWPEALIVYMDGLGRVAGGGGAFQTTDASAANLLAILRRGACGSSQTLPCRCQAHLRRGLLERRQVRIPALGNAP